jgi:hypothetical protein
VAIDINIAIFLSISILVIGLLGLLKPAKTFAMFPFIGAVLGGFAYEYLAADGQIAVSGTNYNDYPFILVPLFLTVVDLSLCFYKIAPSSKILESSTMAMILGGVDAYFVPTLISSYATSANPNLPAALLPFVQNYGEILTVVASVALFVYLMYDIWFK